ncbi:MAG: hypothetical protein QY307_06490 [Acidimicrobiia bacterium]|nr:MAG: hypothetical protein QY307_06490 [Acidimicrobiia bacterium]
MDAADDTPHRNEFEPVGGEWSGVLFANRTVGYSPRLTWTFTVQYKPIRRDYGTTEPSLTVDWVPFDKCSWRSLAGNHASSSRFDEPIEASVYFFDHHRYDSSEIWILEQRGTEVRVRAEVRGDLDGLGLDAFEVDHRLRFRGIYVQPSTLPNSTEEAESLLSKFTDTSGLAGVRRQHNYLFRPTDSEP